MTDDRQLTYTEARALLPPGERILTSREYGGLLTTFAFPRASLLKMLRKHGAELAGPNATQRGYGMVLIDESGPLFIETKSDRPLTPDKHPV